MRKFLLSLFRASHARARPALPTEGEPSGDTGDDGRGELSQPQTEQDVAQKVEAAARLRAALDDGEFTLLHQPVVSLKDGQITSLSAQPRWRSPQGVLFTLAEFLRVAEDSSRSAELDRWMLEEAVEQAAERITAGLPVPVSVRVSARQLMDRWMPLNAIEILLTRHGLPPGMLIIELYDLDSRVSLDELESRLSTLRGFGVRITLGGFVSGNNELTTLRRLPVDVLKLERDLVEGVVESARLHELTSGLLQLAMTLGLQTVADGVDLPEQVVALRAMGCTHGQGMAFSGPLDEYRLRRELRRGPYPLPHESADPAPTGGDVRDAGSKGGTFADQESAVSALLRDDGLSAQEKALTVVTAAGEIEQALARLFVLLGPPPEPTELDYAPAGYGDGGARL